MSKETSRPSETTKRKLLAACGNQCAEPNCDELIFDLDHETILGKIAHIKGRRPKSPRYDKNQTETERNSYTNLIALCGKHHDLIDDNPDRYSVEILIKWKTEHEEKIANISDRNWIGWPSSIIKMTGFGDSLSLHYWVDRNGIARIYSNEQLAVCNTLKEIYQLQHEMHTFLSTIDKINHESQIPWLKQQVKKIKLNEYGYIGTIHELFQIAQEVTFGEYNIFNTHDGRKNKEQLIEDGKKRLKSKADALPKNPDIKKTRPKKV